MSLLRPGWEARPVRTPAGALISTAGGAQATVERPELTASSGRRTTCQSSAPAVASLGKPPYGRRFEIYRDGQVLTICVDLGRTSIQFVEVGLIHFLIL